MEISPIKIFYMTLASVIFGMFIGVFNDINRIARKFFGVRYGKSRFEGVYDVKLPIIKRSLGAPKESKLTKFLLPYVTVLQDIALFFAAGSGVAILNYYFNNGRLRLYTPVAVILGAVIYYFTLGKAFFYFSDLPVFFIKSIFLISLGVFYYPIGFFVKIFGASARKICTNLRKAIAKRQKKVYNIRKKNFVMTNAVRGYVDLTK